MASNLNASMNASSEAQVRELVHDLSKPEKVRLRTIYTNQLRCK